jgi:hypothetical protein
MGDPTYGEGEFIYAKGVANTVAGSVVQIKEDDFTTALLDTDVADTLIGTIGVAMAATVAGEYGWYQVKGRCAAAVSGDVADNAQVFATATAGSVDDTGVVSAQIQGCKTASEDAAGFCELELNYPWIGVVDTAP